MVGLESEKRKTRKGWDVAEGEGQATKALHKKELFGLGNHSVNRLNRLDQSSLFVGNLSFNSVRMLCTL
jgi:hypothetical protein